MNLITIISAVMLGISVYYEQVPAVIGSMFLFFMSPLIDQLRGKFKDGKRMNKVATKEVNKK